MAGRYKGWEHVRLASDTAGQSARHQDLYLLRGKARIPLQATRLATLLAPIRLCPTEDDEQRALFRWREEMLPFEPRLQWLYHIPNGKQRSKAAAGQLKALGVRRGIPDCFLPVAQHGFHGCYLEVKALDGTASPEQLAFLAYARSQGYAAEVRAGWSAGAQYLCWYLDRPDLAPES